MNILIVGSEGFIGSHLCNFFINDHQNIVVGVDIIDTNEINPNMTYQKIDKHHVNWGEILNKFNIDLCINASGIGNVALSIKEPLKDFEANTLDVIKLLEGIRVHRQQCKYIHISSAAVYGNPEKLPISEGDETKPISPYGYHKLMSEWICREYSTLYNIKLIVIRPFSLFGIGLKKQLIWDICNKLKSSDSIELFGTGRETRDFIHISDFVELIDTILKKATFKSQIFNAASGKETSIKNISEIVAKYYKNQKTISFNGQNKPGDPINWQANIDEIINLGFHPNKKIQDAIVEYLIWFDKNS